MTCFPGKPLHRAVRPDAYGFQHCRSDGVVAVLPSGERDLRTILSQVSGRPKECVFSDDPTVKDLWEVTGVTIYGTSGHVTFSYAGTAMTVLSFELAADAKEVFFRSLECEEARPLVLPGHSIQRWLFSFATAKIFDALPE